jgi:para-aminobenzoate synthetase/4-amino-4-deoxychorismate lyase
MKCNILDTALARFPRKEEEWCFSKPREILTAWTAEEVLPMLRRVDTAMECGLFAAGYLAYEAAPAFEPHAAVNPSTTIPLLCFALYDAPEILPRAISKAETAAPIEWRPGIDEAEYREAVDRIRSHIAAGDTYQVNFTFPLYGRFQGDALALFRQLCAAQGGDCAAYLDFGRFIILSVSPELFFTLNGPEIVTRPMKGTRPRAPRFAEDLERAVDLRTSDKERAENVMIVDLLRNDLGRIAETGSVAVSRLFDVEKYPTVWQMTSTVTARSSEPLSGIFAALFPSGSVTGAPKIETMKIIHALERTPRGVYCGAIGWCGPGRRAHFNVAIRTITLDTNTHEAVYPVGSGVTWDSSARLEYAECLDKAAVLHRAGPSFDLLESLRYENGFFLLEEHLDRIEESARYFDYSFDRTVVHQRLLEYARGLGPGVFKVRLLAAVSGPLQIEHAALAPLKSIRLGLAPEPVPPDDIFLYHKTTCRRIYEEARATRPDCGDVLLKNTRGELTESTLANLVLNIDGRLLTPPVTSGLLAGCFRRRLLETGEIAEACLTVDDLIRARAIHLINSVRKWIPVDWAG